MNLSSSLPPPDTPEISANPRAEFLIKTSLTQEQEAVFHRLWDLIANEANGISLEEIHEESAAA